ncbi:solute carrier family 10 (sodium/bile acid cotransporter), member 7 [Tessaracoccus oleiagri]|uniref:Solute carrier family 10 (Sodium/bile acid cotransporter), member 7 n=2 Tax=Tessaracoccus oleiagri TaxID=686624 RepID=A0A1G9LNH3_9ACTN|nr:solute carrier family 10 (sodium/bile acid cotransporter), member 7 [Tessaracoccus oleiagri]
MTLVILGALALSIVLPVRGQAAEVYDLFTKVAVFVLFFGYGARLSTEETLAGVRHWRLHVTILACTFVVFPLLGAPMLLLPDGFVSDAVRAGLVFLCLAPSTVQSSINMTSLAGGNVPAAMISATASNVLGVVLTPLLVMLLLPTNGGGFSWQIALDVFVQLLLPFFLGQISRFATARFMARNRARLKLLDQFVIVLIVYGAFSDMFATGKWRQLGWNELLVTLGFTLPLLAFMLWFTWNLSRWLEFDRPDRIAIMFCGTKKSLVTGVPIAAVLFPAATVGMLVVPLMIYHQAQIITSSLIAARLSASATRED